MDNARKYSIVVPVYNAEKTLARCIDSILAQNYSNFELILVNDGSRDNSWSIIEEYSRIDTRIKAIDKINGGASSARNSGLESACGDYVTFVDSDDVIFESYLSEFNKSNSDCIFTGLNIERPDGVKFINTPKVLIDRAKSEISEFVDLYSLETYFRGAVSKAYKNEIIQKSKIRFDKRLHWGEDFLFTLQFLTKADSITSFNSANYLYYFPAEQGKYKIDADEYIYALTKIIAALNQIGNCDSAVCNAKRWNYGVFVGRLSCRPFNERIKDTFKVLRDLPSGYFPAETKFIKFKTYIELLRVAILSK